MSDDITAIDKAIQQAQARKAMKAGKPTTEAPASTSEEAKEPKRTRLTDEEKAARQASKDAERAMKKADREAARAAKKAEREADRKAPHMSKVTKAAERLPVLAEKAQIAVNELTTNFTAAEVAAIACHLQHFNRVQATMRALGRTVAAGDTVAIISGDPRFIGRTGTVVKAQRIRCYVEVEGAKKPVYLFTSDVEQVRATAKAKSA